MNDTDCPQKLYQLGRKIRALRLKRGWSQEELAEQVSLHRTYVGSIERGERNISFLNLCKFSKVFEVSLSEFFAEGVYE